MSEPYEQPDWKSYDPTKQKYCNECRQIKSLEEFETSPSHGKKRTRARCRECEPKYNARKNFSGMSAKERMTKAAPIRAAIRLLQDRPELLAELVRRDYPRYEKYLEEERLHLLRQREARVLAAAIKAEKHRRTHLNGE